jgi:hypothetical protein
MTVHRVLRFCIFVAVKEHEKSRGFVGLYYESTAIELIEDVTHQFPTTFLRAFG